MFVYYHILWFHKLRQGPCHSSQLDHVTSEPWWMFVQPCNHFANSPSLQIFSYWVTASAHILLCDSMQSFSTFWMVDAVLRWRMLFSLFKEQVLFAFSNLTTNSLLFGLFWQLFTKTLGGGMFKGDVKLSFVPAYIYLFACGWIVAPTEHTRMHGSRKRFCNGIFEPTPI